MYVSGNLLLYYEEGNPGASVAPDVFVVVGANRGDRSSYRLWQEPKGPDFVLEITSRRTHREDQGSKREYWQYDPTSDYLQPALQGLMLDAGEYRRLPGTELADGTLALASEVLGLELRLTERGLRLHDPETRRDGSCRTLPKRTLPLRHLRAAAPEPYHGRPPPDAGAGSRGQPHRGASRRYSGRLKPTGSSRVVAERSAQWRPALKNGRAPPTKQ